MSKKNEVIEEKVMEVEVEADECTEIAEPETKETFVTKVANGIKTHGPKVAKIAIAGVATVAAFALGMKFGGKKDEDDGVIEADYDVLDDNDDTDIVDF